MSGKNADAQAVSPESIVVEVTNADGSIGLVDKNTGEAVYCYEGDFVTYRDRRGINRILDHKTGRFIRDYNDFFVEYYNSDGTSKITNRATGEEAIEGDEYIVEFNGSNGATLFVDRNTGEAVDEQFLDECATLAMGDNGFVDSTIVHWLATAKLDSVSYGEWVKAGLGTAQRKVVPRIPTRKLREKDKQNYLSVECNRQLHWLHLTINETPSNEVVGNLKWWVEDKQSRGYKLMPKFGPKDYVWPEQCEFYPNLTSLKLGLLAFRRRVRNGDYHEPSEE